MKAFGLTFQRLQDNLFVASGRNDFAYSDGHIEEARILEIVNSATDISSSSWELHEKANTWPERYHLSIHRGAIIRCLSAPAKIRVLEMGAGAGAITRALGEKFASVDAIEGSIDRARICASRCRDLPQVRVFSADLGKIEPEPNYDLVVLVGVLEWSSGFLQGENPFQRCFDIASRALTENGKIILAIENQLGLKYFLGSGEDHCGIPMEGLHGYPSFNKAKTFSRKALSSQLLKAGFSTFHVMYPFPDYKLARVILTDEAVSLCNESIGFWAARHPFDDYRSANSYQHANQALVACEVSNAGLLGELSNSFLVIAGKHASQWIQPNWLVWSERPVKNAVLNSTTTLENLGNHLIIKKEYPNVRPRGVANSKFGFKLNLLPAQTFLHGGSVELELLSRAIAGDSVKFLQTLREWMAYAQQKFGLGDGKGLADQAWDCIPRNLIRLKNGHLEAFDLEFGNERPFGLEVLCTRGLLTWFLIHSFWTGKLNPNARTARDQIVWVLSSVFPYCDANITIETTIQRETEFHLWVNSLEEKVDLFDAIDSPIVPPQSASSLHAEVIQLQNHIKRLQTFSDAVRATWVYRFYKMFLTAFKSG